MRVCTTSSHFQHISHRHQEGCQIVRSTLYEDRDSSSSSATKKSNEFMERFLFVPANTREKITLQHSRPDAVRYSRGTLASFLTLLSRKIGFAAELAGSLETLGTEETPSWRHFQENRWSKTKKQNRYGALCRCDIQAFNS